MEQNFEQGPIRPPSEAGSLLIRTTRNCPWNKCVFCRTYKGKKFAIRSPEEVKEDVARAGAIANEIIDFSKREGERGEVTERLWRLMFGPGSPYHEGYRAVARWLYCGGESVFIQDADSLIMKTEDMVSILAAIGRTFPFIKRITTYCRSKTAARKPLDELRSLHDAGLARIHVGMESGYDPLLAFIKKGASAAEHIEAGQKIKAAGISLCEYVIPGLGGERWSREHARETAGVINAINPEFVRLRSLRVVRDTPLMEMEQSGEFVSPGDEAVVREIGEMLTLLQGIETTIVSDHILNLLEEIEGKLPQDRDKMLSVIDRFLDLPEEKRLVFRLGRRMGIYRKISDLADANTYGELKGLIEQYEKREKGATEKHISDLMRRFV